MNLDPISEKGMGFLFYKNFQVFVENKKEDFQHKEGEEMKKYLTIAGVIVWIIIGLAGVVLLFSPKIVEQKIYPVVPKMNGVTLIVCIVFLVMIIFRRLRTWAGLGLFFASYVFGFGWWVLSYIT